MARNADIRGVILFAAPPDALVAAHDAIRTGLEGGTLRPVIAREFPLADAPRAHEAVLYSGAGGKIILVP